MEKGNMDAYIAKFQQLAHQGGHSIDESEILRRFAMGLPRNLADKCYDLHDPDTFEQWVMSAQRNHKVWLKQQSLKGEFSATQPGSHPQGKTNPFANFQWWNKGQGCPTQGPKTFTPRDPNAMNTSACQERVPA
jgi:hypothetical protein